jgi:hypothetical protein
MTEWTVNNKLNAWYQKRYHIKLPKQYETKARLYFSTYSPSSLFSAGEQGVWFDPSDVANLNWRRNLLTWTEQFDNAAWTKAAVSVSANAAVAPDGTTTADKLVEDTANSLHGTTVSNIFTATGLPYTYSVYVKQAERRYVLVAPTLTFNSTSASSIFDTQTGSWVLSGSLYSNHFAVSAGNGWWRIGFTNSVNDVSYDNIRIGLSSGATVADLTYTGDGTSGILIWGAQLELGSVATDYQRITDVNTEVIARFPTATLYQDPAGTTPVTTTGQSVGLMLDKSKGLVLGSELVTNGDFSSGASWTAGTGWTIAGGVASANIAAGVNLDQSLTTTTNKSYVVTFTITSYTSGGIRARLTGAANISGSVRSAVGTYTEIFHATATNSVFRMVDGGGGFVGSIDSISVKELPGNHAVQATAANRPIYGIHPVGGRRNLLVRTEEFENASWVKTGVTVTANAATAPDGTNTADKIVATVATGEKYLQQSSTAGGANVFSFYAKEAEYYLVRMQELTSFGFYATFNLKTGAVTATGGGSFVSASAVPVGNGWYRCSVANTRTVANAYSIGGFPDTISPTNTPANYTGDGTSGVFFWGAQLETGSTATAYQRVTDQYNVTEAGVSSVSYLFFDGVNDSMATSTITPGVDKAQVFAGVRKLSDTLAGVLVELSATSASNNGSLILSAPFTSTNAGYGFGSRGTTRVVAEATSGFAAPITNVITGIGDISGDVSRLRANGAQIAADTTTDQGTGNFLAYPLYIGARNGSTLFFSGHLYSLVTRFGANLTADQIADTETWVAGETGFFAPVISGVPTVGVS